MEDVRKRSMLWIWIAVGLVLLIGVGYLVYKNSANADVMSSETYHPIVNESKYSLQPDPQGHLGSPSYKILENAPAAALSSGNNSFQVRVVNSKGSWITDRKVTWAVEEDSRNSTNVLPIDSNGSVVNISATSQAYGKTIYVAFVVQGQNRMYIAFSPNGMSPNNDFDFMTKQIDNKTGGVTNPGWNTNAILKPSMNTSFDVDVWLKGNLAKGEMKLKSSAGVDCGFTITSGLSCAKQSAVAPNLASGAPRNASLTVTGAEINKDGRRVTFHLSAHNFTPSGDSYRDLLTFSVQGLGSRIFTINNSPATGAATSTAVAQTATSFDFFTLPTTDPSGDVIAVEHTGKYNSINTLPNQAASFHLQVAFNGTVDWSKFSLKSTYGLECGNFSSLKPGVRDDRATRFCTKSEGNQAIGGQSINLISLGSAQISSDQKMIDLLFLTNSNQVIAPTAHDMLTFTSTPIGARIFTVNMPKDN